MLLDPKLLIQHCNALANEAQKGNQDYANDITTVLFHAYTYIRNKESLYPEQALVACQKALRYFDSNQESSVELLNWGK
jgi:CRISPR/Cas system Type II protein with McrA/HNH and RuvC-like nuclease domain